MLKEGREGRDGTLKGKGKERGEDEEGGGTPLALPALRKEGDPPTESGDCVPRAFRLSRTGWSRLLRRPAGDQRCPAATAAESVEAIEGVVAKADQRKGRSFAPGALRRGGRWGIWRGLRLAGSSGRPRGDSSIPPSLMNYK